MNRDGGTDIPMKILDFGSLNIDHVYHLKHLVREGETLSSDTYRKNAGGKGLNQAIALARAGCRVYFAGAVGKDGLFLKEYLESFGVDTTRLKTLDEPTGHAIIQVDEEGRNSIILYGGANRKITDEMIDQALDGFEPGDYILLQNEISGLSGIMKKAAQKGLRIALNPSPISPALLNAPLDVVNCFLLNEVEGADLTGENEPDKILDALLSRYPACRAVLTLGEKGSIYADKNTRARQDAVRVRAVDTTAAGDTFTGYFLSSMLLGEPVARSLYTAAVASAIAVSRPGAGASIPARAEVLSAMAK